MKSKVMYLINSKNRSEKCFNRTYSLIKHLEPLIVIEPQDEIDYLKFFKKDELVILPHNDKGLTWSRNWCLNHFEADVLWLIDDNIKGIFKRNGLSAAGYHKMIPAKMDPSKVNDLLLHQGYAQGSISFKPSNWYYKPDLKTNTRIWGITAFNTKSLKEKKINYDLDMVIFQGVDITAQILSKGLSNVIDYEYAFDKTMCEDNKGVGSYRTEKMSKDVCGLLKAKWGIKSKLTKKGIYEPKFKWKDIKNGKGKK
jgi:macrodomain Ter protein organizer (MatP/YcbG family)